MIRSIVMAAISQPNCRRPSQGAQHKKEYKFALKQSSKCDMAG